MRHARYQLKIGGSDRRESVTRSKDIAKALVALFQVSCGRLNKIAITGGGECAFIAALAFWLFGLKIWVEGDQQNIIYRNVEEPAKAQVSVIYSNHATNSAVITSTTYNLPEYSDLFRTDPENQDNYLISQHPWDGYLSAFYGITFERLQQKSDVLRTYLRSVARIYEALALGEKGIESIAYLFECDSVELAYGLGYVTNILSTFPELERINGLRNTMISAAQVSFEKALELSNASVAELEATCIYNGMKDTHDCPENAVHASVLLRNRKASALLV
ncbi:hypothetical protein MMC34_001325 [Xylographa carneopallida]|nr:hypothetical protein [Xylographa carneopallida]